MKLNYLIVFIIVYCGHQLQQCVADTPANCTYEDIKGYWLFKETDPIKNRYEKCDDNGHSDDYKRKIYLRLDYPDVAVDKFGNIGHWTLIYNQGFEVVINYRKYFAFSSYKQLSDNEVVSYCHKTLPGWSHDVLGNNWACYVGQKLQQWDDTDDGRHQLMAENSGKKHIQSPLYLKNVDLRHALSEQHVNHINSRQNLWKATVYTELQSKSIDHLINMAGGEKSRLISRPSTVEATEEQKKLVQSLPQSFDWRNVNGVNYVSPVRSQGNCGSCYSFASMAMLESRIRIATNNTQQPVFSPQDVVDCSEYSQGCSGGFGYLIAGKYAQDFGVIEEECYPYKGKDGKCQTRYQNQTLLTETTTKCRERTFVIKYGYVGGYYGGANEEAMIIELVRNGPIAVGFEVYKDFFTYKNGVYSHDAKYEKISNLAAEFNPFSLTNHAVVIVGYGRDPKTNEKYWIVKNSWGTEWGMDGYFHIRRGNNECGIESLPMAAVPIPN